MTSRFRGPTRSRSVSARRFGARSRTEGRTHACFRWLPAFLARRLTRRGRRRHLRTTCSGAWLAALELLPFALDLTVAQVRSLVRLAQEFEGRIRWKGHGDWRPDALARASISLQACRLVLHLGLERYARVRTVFVYPSSWSGSTSTGNTILAGEAGHDWVRIAWDMAQWSTNRPADGYSVVYHEFAHVLDYHDGHFDGMPVLRDPREHPGWQRIFQHGLIRLRGILSRREPSALRDYGSTDPAEFFAVCTESFFERPQVLRRRHPEIYSALARFYHQDPAGRGQRRTRKAWKNAKLGPVARARTLSS